MIALQRAALAGRVRAFDAKTVAWKPPAEVVPEPVAAPVVRLEPDPVPEPTPLVLPHASHWLPVRMPPKRYPSVEDIQRVVIRGTKVTLREIRSPCRFAHVALRRQIAMFLAVEFMPTSKNEIARRFGRDHASLHHAIGKIFAMIASDPAFDDEIAVLRGEIRQSFCGPAE